jgi:hypothetical protein
MQVTLATVPTLQGFLEFSRLDIAPDAGVVVPLHAAMWLRRKAMLSRSVSMQVIPVQSPVSDVCALISGDPIDDIDRAVAEYLEGGTPFRILMTLDGRPKALYVDDLAIPKELPRNERATRLYQAKYIANNPDADPATLPYVAGPAVLVDWTEVMAREHITKTPWIVETTRLVNTRSKRRAPCSTVHICTFAMLFAF